MNLSEIDPNFLYVSLIPTRVSIIFAKTINTASKFRPQIILPLALSIICETIGIPRNIMITINKTNNRFGTTIISGNNSSSLMS